MKRLSTAAAKLQGDSTLTSSRAAYEDPYVYNLSDSEPMFEQSRKIQKKRDTYQKIPDDIRVQVLELVQNGETLKSAAKRFQINYSSAKSILHTYRKEGRILKKSAQERAMKKKVTHDEDAQSVERQVAKPAKKEAKNNKKTVAPLAERTISATTCASYSDEKSSPAYTNTASESLVSTLKMEHCETQHARHAAAHEDYTGTHEAYNMNRGARQNSMAMDNFYMKYSDYHFPDVGGDYYRNEVSDYPSGMHFSNEFDPLSVLQPRLPKNEEPFHGSNNFFYQKGFNGGYGFEDKATRPDNGLYYEENLENAGNPLKSFMDSQILLQEALKKTNFWTGSANQGFRKSSFDMF